MSRRSRLRTLVRQMLRPCKRMGATIGRMRTIKILMTGGGSSGHISPALAITDTLGALAVGADWQPRFRYVGGKRGIEQRIVTSAGLDFVGIETGKLRRYFSLENLTDMLRIPVGVGQALAEVRRFDPDIVLSTGGYVGVPPVLAPRLLRKPIVTGNPVRALIFGGDGSEGARISGFAAVDDQLPTVYVTGGSQGARIINRAVEAALPELLERCRVIHQCGEQPVGEEQDYDRLAHARAQLPPELRQRYFVTRFVGDEIKHIFALADLVVGRAGAGTIAEICVLGKPALYIPLVPTGGDEQTRNAQACAQAGAAAIVPQADLSGPRLLAEVGALLADRARLVAMGRAALTLGKPNAARDVAQALLALAGVEVR